MSVDFVTMAKILVTCTECTEDIPLPPHDVNGRVCSDNGDASYRFTCTECGAIVVKSTSGRMIEALEIAGVEIEMWTLPAELYEARKGPLLTHEDLLDFHGDLEDDETVAAAIEQLLI